MATKGEMLRSLMAQLDEIKRIRPHKAIPLFLHSWPARREHGFVRGMLLASMALPVDDIAQLHASPVAYPDLVVLDPFAGSGTTIIEGIRLGCRTIGFDVNPIAAWLIRNRLLRTDLNTLDTAVERLESSVMKLSQQYYTTKCVHCDSLAANRTVVHGWIHHCVSCSKDSAVVREALFVERKELRVYVCPACQAVTTARSKGRIDCAGCGRELPGRATLQRPLTVKCSHCDQIADFLPGEHPTVFSPGILLIEYDCDFCGHQFKKPDAYDVEQLLQAEQFLVEQGENLLLPDTILPALAQFQRYGLQTFAELFTARQRLILGSCLSSISNVPDDTVQDTLLVLFSHLLGFNSRLCHYNKVQGLVNAFSRLVYTIPVCYGEGNPGNPNSAASLMGLYQRNIRPAKEQLFADQAPQIAHRVKGWPEVRLVETFDDLGSESAWITCASATAMPLPDQSVDVIVTDPPYYDNIQYGHLSNFSYVWLHRVLSQRYAWFTRDTALTEDEIVVGRDSQHRSQAVEEYEVAIGEAFIEMERVLKKSGTLVYIFQTSDIQAFTRNFQWLLDAGLMVVELWPLDVNEQKGILQAASQGRFVAQTVFACRKRGGGRPVAWTVFQHELLGNLQRKLSLLEHCEWPEIVETLWGEFIIQYSQSFPYIYHDSREAVSIAQAVTWMHDLVGVVDSVTTNLSTLAAIQEIRRRVSSNLLDEAEASDQMVAFLDQTTPQHLPSIETSLRERLGASLWAALEPETRRFLVTAEYHYRMSADKDLDNGIIAVGFAKPLEMELKGKLCRRLADFGRQRYPDSAGIRADKLRISWDRLSAGETELGKVENLLRSTSLPENLPLREYLAHLSPEARTYALTSLPDVIKRFREEGRNPGAHTGVVPRSVVDELRSVWFDTATHLSHWVAL